MALFKPGLGFSAISGTIGGTVFARNRSGMYTRNWAKPVNPTTTPQSEARMRIADAAANYQLLTLSAVNAWDAYAAQSTRLNRLGEQYIPTGRQVYIEQFINMTLAGLPALDLPGPTVVGPSIEGALLTVATVVASLFTVLTATFTQIVAPSGADPADAALLVYASPAHWPQVGNVNNRRRLIGQGSIPAVSPLALGPSWNAIFGASAEVAQLITLWLRAVDPGTGLTSPTIKLERTIA